MKLILTLLLTLSSLISVSQDNPGDPVKQNIIELTIGQNQFRDENLHPKTFSGLNFGASYLHASLSNRISEYSAGFRVSLMNTAFEDFPSSLNILLVAKYRYLFTIVLRDNLNYYFGPLADMQYGTSAYFNWDESHFYFANYLSGGISNRITFSMKERSFDFNLDFPLVSCISRPEFNRQYKIDDMTFGGILSNLASNPEVVLPNRNFFVRAGVEMNYTSGGKRSRSVGYNFRYHYMRAADGMPYQNIENSISYKFIF